ncbi:MAG: hypothetical protein QG635_825 [Bacteroidota bacterium]|nr:hypothetical protein [Bacteroidota bacterium]
MEIGKPTSTNPLDYEILIRKRGEDDYAAYCPQLYVMIKGAEHEEVRDKMKQHIESVIENILSQNGSMLEEDKG